MNTLARDDCLSVGRIVNTHGIKGEIRVIPETSDVSRFDYLLSAWIDADGGMKEYRVTGVRYHKGFVLLKLKGIDDLTEAEKLKGHDLLINRKDARKLEEDEFFIFDLIGIHVYEGERLLGDMTEVLETGGNDVYVVKSGDGAEILIPALKSVILDVNIAQRRMSVKLPEGLLDEV